MPKYCHFCGSRLGIKTRSGGYSISTGKELKDRWLFCPNYVMGLIEDSSPHTNVREKDYAIRTN